MNAPRSLILLALLGVGLAFTPLALGAVIDPIATFDATAGWTTCFVDANVDYQEWCGAPPVPDL